MVRVVDKKENFKPFVYEGGLYNVCWDYRDEVQPVYVKDEETGKRVFSGEVKETNRCTFMIEQFREMPTLHQIKSAILKSKIYQKSVGTIRELRQICESIGVESNRIKTFLRLMLLEMVMLYDSSPSVNGFTIGNTFVWLDKNTRVGLKLRFESEIALGKTETTLWLNGKSFTLPLIGEGNAIDMLTALELYASACYDRTQQHVAAVKALITIDEMETYDYKSGYPEKLVF